MGIFPQNDTFQEFTTPYGERLASYIRHVPWLTAGDAGSGYAIDTSRATMHDGYSTAYRLASFRSDTVGGEDPSLCSVIWRQSYLTHCRASVTFLCVVAGGAPTYQDFRYAGVCVRVSGGTYDETDPTGAQFVKDTSGYWLILARDPAVGATVERWLLVRVNSGVTTLLFSQAATAEVQNTFSGAHEMSLGVTTSGGNVILTAYYDGESFMTHTDSSVSKITAAGRCGFGLCRDRRNIGGTFGKNLATVASRFTITDTTLNRNVLADDFKRVNRDCNPVTGDSIGTSGKVIMSMWTLDIHGLDAWTNESDQYRDPGEDRIDARGGTYNFSQIAASDLYTQARSARFFKNSTETELVATGILLRGSFSATGNVQNGYLFTINFVNTTYTAILRRYNSGTPTTIATAVVSTGYGLTITDEYELLASVQSSGGTPSRGSPVLTMKINGVIVANWTVLAAGATATFNQVTDGSASAIMQGSAQGLQLIPPDPGGGKIFYRLWTDEVGVSVDPIDEENEPSIFIPSECVGKVGELTVPIGSKFRVESRSRIVSQEFETGHVARVMFDRAQRRRWSIELPAALGDERDDLWEFWDAHGKGVPFDFTDPEDGTTICAHFADDSLSTLKLAPEANSYSFTVEELFDNDTINNIAVAPAVLRITGQRPQIGPIKVVTRHLVLRPQVPLITTIIPVPPGSLTLTGQVPSV